MPSIASLKESASSGLQKAAKSVGIETKESDAVDELSDMCPKLSYQQVRYWIERFVIIVRHSYSKLNRFRTAF